jgi:hypothetical protein
MARNAAGRKPGIYLVDGAQPLRENFYIQLPQKLLASFWGTKLWDI